METLIVEVLDKIKPTDPLRWVKQTSEEIEMIRLLMKFSRQDSNLTIVRVDECVGKSGG